MYNNEYRGFGGFKICPYTRGDDDFSMSDCDESESNMPEYQLGRMYSQIYFIIYPQVIMKCDDFDKACCCGRIPSDREMDKMVSDICTNVEDKVKSSMSQQMRESEDRQLGFGERGILGDLTRILLIRELFDRRHRPHRRFREY